jgi:hypothetical protein
MNHLTSSEHIKLHEISERLGRISSPVLRLQAILQYSQIVDILMLGDTQKENSDRLMNSIDELQDKDNEYKEHAQANGNGETPTETPTKAGASVGSPSVACDSETVT